MLGKNNQATINSFFAHLLFLILSLKLRSSWPNGQGVWLRLRNHFRLEPEDSRFDSWWGSYFFENENLQNKLKQVVIESV